MRKKFTKETSHIKGQQKRKLSGNNFDPEVAPFEKLKMLSIFIYLLFLCCCS